MRAIAFQPYNDDFVLLKSPFNILPGKNFNNKIPIKLKRKIPCFIERRKTLHSRKDLEKLESKKTQHYIISKEFEQLDEFIFYSLHGVIQMATFPKSDN